MDKKIPYLDLGVASEYTYPTHGHHWTPEGHTLVSKKIYEFLIKESHLDMVTTPNELLDLRTSGEKVLFLKN